ncbi:glycoside hydrolase family 2 protein [Phlebiopsis gigantea 11061_1 CR5-6]|uniref:Beta-mannosidase B n=1 Tax=Phlebiopsis gigantea (strain 11061_1 CR5-6) TaxID=745531 RepID=A0A0C3S440_PHLG1|nr:glycoside hydrolase family 2 protein [Phlebiopsis gigantea 11061_1 CR5-6]
MSSSTSALSGNWYWKEADASSPTEAENSVERDPTWHLGGDPPSEIHVLLHKAGLISDAYKGFNEHDRDWLFRHEFRGQPRADNPYSLLTLEGLDTVCDVYLNGIKILETDNMFRAYTARVETHLQPGDALNTLVLHFKSAQKAAKALEAQHGKVRAGSANLGDPSRVYLRKAQYDWRWDWGPEIMTCGPYRPITLTTFRTRIAALDVRTAVDAQLEPSMSIAVDFEGPADNDLAVNIVLSDPDTSNAIIAARLSPTDLAHDSPASRWELGDKVELWWPVNYGLAKQYDLRVSLVDSKSGAVVDTRSMRVGFRRIELVQEPLESEDRYGTGSTFLFQVNGVRMFMGGSNWIPADNFLTTVTPDRYRAWLTLLRDGNQNMVRLWGGGVYEPDVFYDICDELGILVWQDFQFACGVYPAHPEFVENVRKEAIYNVDRLKHHPCMAVFCGNNEDYQQVLQWGDVSDLPARLLYEDILPGIVKDLTGGNIAYHPGSPYGGKGWDTADPTVGDIHQWDVWAGKELAWHNYGSMGGRFISEFGIPAMPDIRTVDYWLDGGSDERWVGSPLMAQHCRAGSHERRFAIVMNESFRPTADLETHIYQQQLMQSEAVGLAYRMWRREWRGTGKQFCGGALVWQLNDCWPVTSWALIDYFMRPKLAYYAVARELKPVTVGIFRTVTKNRSNDRPAQFYEFGAFRAVSSRIEVWGCNSTLRPVSATLEVRAFDLRSAWTHTETRAALLLPNQSTDLLASACPRPPGPDPTGLSPDRAHTVVVAARLLAPATGEVLARCSDWPQPYRHGTYPEPAVSLAVEANGKTSTVTVRVDRPVKGLTLGLEGKDSADVSWSDNGIDVVPGDPQTVTLCAARVEPGLWRQVHDQPR